MNRHTTPSVQDVDTLGTRFALRVTAGLTEHSQTLPRDVSERLRFAREQALTKAQAARAAQLALQPRTALSAAAAGRASLALAGGPLRWLKAASVLPLIVLVAGLLLLQHSQWYEQITAAADVDTALLADNVPPSAYSDPGFAEYLRDEQATAEPTSQQ